MNQPCPQTDGNRPDRCLGQKKVMLGHKIYKGGPGSPSSPHPLPKPRQPETRLPGSYLCAAEWPPGPSHPALPGACSRFSCVQVLLCGRKEAPLATVANWENTGPISPFVEARWRRQTGKGFCKFMLLCQIPSSSYCILQGQTDRISNSSLSSPAPRSL